MLKSMSTNVARLKQQAMVKIGKSEETVDIEFNEAHNRMLKEDAIFDKINKDINEYLKLQTKLTLKASELAQDIAQLYEVTDPDYGSLDQIVHANHSVDKARQESNDSVNAYFITPLNLYISQFVALKQRCVERGRRKVDMDRYIIEQNKLAKESASKPGAAEKLHATESKLERARQNYHELNTEIVKDMDAVWANKTEFFHPLLANFVKSQSHYYAKATDGLKQAMSAMNHVDETDGAKYQSAITNPSCADRTLGEARASEGAPQGAAPPHHQPAHQQPPLQQPPHAAQAPPKPLPAPGKPALVQARVLYDFQGQDESEINLKAGDVLQITVQTGEVFSF